MKENERFVALFGHTRRGPTHVGVLHERSKKLVYELSIAPTLHLGAHTAYRAGSDTNTANHILRPTSLDDTHPRRHLRRDL